MKELKISLIWILVWSSQAWAFSAVPSRAVATDQFNISQSTLGAAAPRIIFSDPVREVNHAHVSPDHTKIAFTRYNNCTNCGFVRETGGYYGTEIIICNIDGSHCYDLASADIAKIQCNAQWIDNSNVWIDYADPAINYGLGTPRSVNIASGLVNRMLDGKLEFSYADPQQVGITTIHTYLSIVPNSNNGIGLTDMATGTDVVLSAPIGGPLSPHPYGDFDPKLSPDGTSAVWMRHLAANEYHIIKATVPGGVETDLSSAGSNDAVPGWSSDHLKIIFGSGAAIMTMNPNGSARMRVALSKTKLYAEPDFYPGDGSGLAARIVYERMLAP